MPLEPCTAAATAAKKAALVRRRSGLCQGKNQLPLALGRKSVEQSRAAATGDDWAGGAGAAAAGAGGSGSLVGRSLRAQTDEGLGRPAADLVTPAGAAAGAGNAANGTRARVHQARCATVAAAPVSPISAAASASLDRDVGDGGGGSMRSNGRPRIKKQ